MRSIKVAFVGMDVTVLVQRKTRTAGHRIVDADAAQLIFAVNPEVSEVKGWTDHGKTTVAILDGEEDVVYRSSLFDAGIVRVLRPGDENGILAIVSDFSRED